ncbi:MAG: malonyl-CoA decarboxylase, partial [Cupriavidus sp.]|nr:malonyl-CoA decarboxylase [Cupriavidus sp.]
MTALDPADQLKVSAPLDASEPVSDSLFSRFGRWWNRKGDDAPAPATPDPAQQTLSTRAVKRQREQLRQCFEARLTDGAANAAALAWQDEYQAAVEPLRQAMLGVLADVAAGRDAPGGTGSGSAGAAGTASGLSQALSNARIRFFKRFAAHHGKRG